MWRQTKGVTKMKSKVFGNVFIIVLCMCLSGFCVFMVLKEGMVVGVLFLLKRPKVCAQKMVQHEEPLICSGFLRSVGFPSESRSSMSSRSSWF